MPAVVTLEETKTFQEVREEKTWLTSNEASWHIFNNCPNILRGLGGKSEVLSSYRRLYKMVDTDKVVRGCYDYNSSGQRVRFYLKQDLDYIENLVCSSETEATLVRRMGKQLSHLQELDTEIAKLEQKRDKAQSKYEQTYCQMQLKEKGNLSRRFSYWNYCL